MGQDAMGPTASFEPNTGGCEVFDWKQSIVAIRLLSSRGTQNLQTLTQAQPGGACETFFIGMKSE